MLKNQSQKGNAIYIILGLVVLVVFIALIIISIMKRNPLQKTLLPEPVAVEPSNSFDETSTEINKGVYLDSIDVVLRESFPVQAEALVRGNLANGCVEIVDTSVQRNATTFIINIITRTRGDVCTQALVPFERLVRLPIEGFARGTYTVMNGDVKKTFSLSTANTPVFESDK